MPEQLTKKKLLVFLSHANEDKSSVRKLCNRLRNDGFDPWLDEERLLPGQSWELEIETALRASDLIVLCFSEKSVAKEGVVQREFKRAMKYQEEKPDGTIFVIPVRLDKCGIPFYIQKLQWVDFPSQYDRLLLSLQKREKKIQIGGIKSKEIIRKKTSKANTKATSPQNSLSAINSEVLSPPIPEFIPQIWDKLEVPGGALKLNDPFYIERNADETLKNEFSSNGRTITICAARQTGKTSLLFRGMEHAKEKKFSTVYLNAQTIDKEHLVSMDKLLRNFAEYVIVELGLDLEKIDRFWPKSPYLTPQQKISYFFQNYILVQDDKPIIIGLDEIDKLFETDYYSDFFALIRSWHDNRARDKRWNKLTIAMVISTEPYLLIANYQSPFNVGKTIYLEDFNCDQVIKLNHLHSSPINPADISSLMDLIGGHPYLIRQALYVMVTEKSTWVEIEKSRHK